MSELSITTTQNVTINFKAAAVGERVLGTFIDEVIKWMYYFFMFYVIIGGTGLSSKIDAWDAWSQAAVFIILFSPMIFYTLVQESLWDGQTIGKKIMRTKVVKIDGYQASFGDYIIRWLFRAVEVTFPLTVIGIFVLVFSKRTQRIGDVTAGTAVISLKNNININHTIIEQLDDQYVPVYPLVIKLSDNDVRIIKEAFLKAQANRDYALLIKLRDKIIAVTGIKNISGNDTDFIKTILKDYNYYTQSM